MIIIRLKDNSGFEVKPLTNIYFYPIEGHIEYLSVNSTVQSVLISKIKRIENN